MGLLRRLLIAFALSASAAACSNEYAPGREAAVAWALSDTGAGPVRIGMSRSELASVGVPIDRSGGGCEIIRPSSAPFGVSVMVVADGVARVDVVEAGIATAAGIKVGSTEDEVKKAYPWVRVQLHKYEPGGHYLVADVVDEAPGTKRRYVFETNGETVTRYRLGRSPEVDWVEGCG